MRKLNYIKNKRISYEKQKLFYQLYLVRLVYLLYTIYILILIYIYIYSEKNSHPYLIYRWVNTQILYNHLLYLSYIICFCVVSTKKKMESSFIIMSCHFIFSLNTTTRYYSSRLVDTLTSM